MKLQDLCKGALPPEIYSTWEKQGIVEALPLQQTAIEAGLFDGRSLLVVAPTSSGKTFLGEMLAFQKAVVGSRAIYLVPFKAIAEERHAEFTSRYRDNPSLGFRCIVSDRDHHESDADLLNGKYDVAILTYEKLSALLVANQGLLSTCSAVVIDEVQMISDENRGPGLELLLTKLRRLEPRCQLLALSAVLGRLNDFDRWLGAQLIREEKRPVELRIGIVGPDGRFSYREANSGKSSTENLVSGTLSALIAELTKRDEQVLIFSNTVRATNELAVRLADALHLPAATNAIRQLSDEADTETRETLLRVLRNGVAFHNSDCELPERLIVEGAFRSREIRVLVSTTTLSMGVNLPVDNVVLGDNGKWSRQGGRFVQIPWRVAEVKNMLGRAGRFGKSVTFGRGLILAETPAEVIQNQRRYLNAEVEPLSSALANTDVDTRVLAVVASGYASSVQEIEEFLFDTFAGLGWSGIRPQMNALISAGLKRCLELELIETDGAKIRATRLGGICAANNLSLETFKDLKEYVISATGFDALDASFAAARAAEVKDYVPRIRWDDPDRNFAVRTMMNARHAANKLVGLIQSVFSFMVENQATSHEAELTIANVCHTVLDSEKSMREICAAYRISGANLRNICEGVSWMVDVMAGIASALRPEIRMQFQELSACLIQRAPYSCRLLGDLPNYVSRDERIKLRARGIERTEQFLDLAPSELSGTMSPSKADRAMRTLNENRERSSAYWLRDHKRRLDALGFRTELIEKVYLAKDKELEVAVTELFNTGFAKLTAERIKEQRSGEPDQILLFPTGKKLSVQITAKESNAKFVDSKKAGDVISQSARFHVDGFVCIGRPDFEALAKEQAGHLGQKYNYKQLPISVLAELYVRVSERRISAQQAEEFIFEQRGYLSLAQLPSIAPQNPK